MDGETLKERTTRLEQLLGEWLNEVGIVASWANCMRKDVEFHRHLIEQNDELFREKMRNMKAVVQTLGED